MYVFTLEKCFMVIRVVEFQGSDTKLDRLLPKNQKHTERKLLNFQNLYDLKIDFIKKCQYQNMGS